MPLACAEMHSNFSTSLGLKNGRILQLVSPEKLWILNKAFSVVTSSVVSSEQTAGAKFCKLQR